MITKAIKSHHNVKSEVEIGRRVSDFRLSDDQHRSFFPFVQTKTPGCRKKDHYHTKLHAKPWYCSFKTHKTRSLYTFAMMKTQDLRFLDLKDFFFLKVWDALESPFRRVFSVTFTVLSMWDQYVWKTNMETSWPDSDFNTHILFLFRKSEVLVKSVRQRQLKALRIKLVMRAFPSWLFSLVVIVPPLFGNLYLTLTMY